MKHLSIRHLFLLVLLCAGSFTVLSCEDDRLTDQQLQPDYASLGVSESPYNSYNPYDYAGRIHDELLHMYYAQDSIPNTTAGACTSVEELAASHEDFHFIQPTDYQSSSVLRVSAIMANGATAISTAIDNADMSIEGEINLSRFVDDFTDVYNEEEDYSEIYNLIIGYENEVLTSNTLTSSDKKIILVTTSILRFSSLAAKKRPKKNKDPAWEILICHIAGTIEGASSSVAEAITMGLVSGIEEN